MKARKSLRTLLSLALALVTALSLTAQGAFAADGSSNMFENSDFIETEQPELSAETKQLISLYHRKPTEENYLNLRDMVIYNYDLVLERKEAKLAELMEETAGKPGGEAKVAEMREIVQEMYMTYWNRINSSMLRFTDSRLLQWSVSNASNYEYIPVMGAGVTIEVKRTPVTNEEYAAFLAATGREAPASWTDGTCPEGEEDYPVNCVSCADAEAYCAWLTETDGTNVYRLPNESEWELAAGHMPKDAEFNCGIHDGRTPVDAYSDVTRGAHGAVDFWGNVWEWTSTDRGEGLLGVKGGSWKSERTDCRTEYRKEGRDPAQGYEDVGFRVIKVLNGEEPEQKVELATMDAPVVSAVATGEDTVLLTWQPVEGAVAYQMFTCSAATGLVEMTALVTGTSYTAEGADSGTRYIVQPISYVAICDNVSAEYSVGAVYGTDEPSVVPAFSYDYDRQRLTLTWEPVDGVETYYVYKYDQERQRLSRARTVDSAERDCSISYTVEPGTACQYLVSAVEMDVQQPCSGANCISVLIPEQR